MVSSSLALLGVDGGVKKRRGIAFLRIFANELSGVLLLLAFFFFLAEEKGDEIDGMDGWVDSTKRSRG